VEREMRKFKRGALRSGSGGRGGRVKSRKQAIAIGLSEARREGKRLARRAGGPPIEGGALARGQKSCTHAKAPQVIGPAALPSQYRASKVVILPISG
jgi:hypothetical protein